LAHIIPILRVTKTRKIGFRNFLSSLCSVDAIVQFNLFKFVKVIHGRL